MELTFKIITELFLKTIRSFAKYIGYFLPFIVVSCLAAMVGNSFGSKREIIMQHPGLVLAIIIAIFLVFYIHVCYIHMSLRIVADDLNAPTDCFPSFAQVKKYLASLLALTFLLIPIIALGGLSVFFIKFAEPQWLWIAYVAMAALVCYAIFFVKYTLAPYIAIDKQLPVRDSFIYSRQLISPVLLMYAAVTLISYGINYLGQDKGIGLLLLEMTIPLQALFFVYIYKYLERNRDVESSSDTNEKITLNDNRV